MITSESLTIREPSIFSEVHIREIAEGTRDSIARWVRQISQERGLTFRPRPSDVFAAAAARLSDAEVEFDETERLLLALERARVIDGFQRSLLHFSYLR